MHLYDTVIHFEGVEVGRIFKTPDFVSWANDEGVSDETLLAAIKEVETGLIDANLGGNVIKKRVARPNDGKSGGFRTIIAFKSNDNAFFIFGFAKNEKENLSLKEKKALKLLAKEYFSYDDKQLATALKVKELIEVEETSK
jgi:hypothetical protein